MYKKTKVFHLPYSSPAIREGDMRCSNTYVPGLSVNLSGHNGTFCVDIIDRRNHAEGDVYRIVTSNNANVAYGLYQYIRVADSIVVKMIFESSKG